MYYILGSALIYSFIVSIIFNKKYKLFNEINIFLLVSFFICIIGLRYGVGKDYFTYENGFNIGEKVGMIEPLYSYLINKIRIMDEPFYVVTFIMAFITNLLIYIGVKNKKIKGIYLFIAFTIYISDIGFIYANLMKQGVAVAIFFYASKYIKDRNLKKYLMCILVGMGFHYSMVFMIPIYWIYNINIKKKIYIILIILAYGFVATGIASELLNFFTLLNSNYAIYHNSQFILNNEIDLLSLGVLIKVLLSIILVILSSDDKDNEFILEKNFYKIGVLINILSISSFMYDRVGVYFSIFSIVAIPKIIANLKNNKKYILIIITIIIYSFIFVKSLIISPGDLMLEYKSIFNII